jgi:ATP-dependent helicase/nuclease subunit A
VTHLTDEQEHAVARRAGSLLLAAGAGSGKTSVLVERFVRAVREDGVAPGRILAITFTERAAGELRERVRARLLELGERDTARATEAAFVGTFHSFCARLLRIHPLQGGVEPGFQILDEGLANRLQTLAFSDALAGFLEGETAEAVDLVAAYGADPLRAMVLGAYAQLRSQGQDEPRLPSPFSLDQSGEYLPGGARGRGLGDDASGGGPENDVSGGGLGNDASDSALKQAEAGELEATIRTSRLIGEFLERFGQAYALRKHARDALDFDDLELKAGRLLRESDAIRRLWATRFELLMVDEFQDSNPRQLQVLAALDRDNLFTVGDELQSIYGFRHADVSLFRERHAQLSRRGASLALTRNFRSLSPILAAVDRIFEQRIGERFVPLLPMRSDHAVRGDQDERRTRRRPQPRDGESDASTAPIVELLLTDKRGWENILGDEELRGMPEATAWRQAEARLLAGRIAELVESGEAHAGEIVVLMRALSDLPIYESALRRRGLPTLAVIGGFWSHQQVGDLLAWLRALANPLDELALYSTLASPLVGVSSDGLALIAQVGRERGRGVWASLSEGSAQLDGALSDMDRERVVAFRELFAAERAGAALYPISELLRRVIAASGYEAHVLSLGWGEQRLANVHKLVRLARRFEAQEGRDLRAFLDHVAHIELALAGRESDAPVGDGEIDAVRLMSIHAAKGLEFPVVCVADLGREPNLRMPNLLVDSASGRLGLRLSELGSPESVPALDFEELCEERRRVQEEEEDRVLYVACTRAENRLLLSGSVSFERWPASKPGVAPIAWLAPALVPDAPSLGASEERPGDSLTVDVGAGLLVRCVFHSPDGADRSRPARSVAAVEQPAWRTESAQAAQLSLAIEGASVSATGLARTMPTVRREVPSPMPLADLDGTMSYTSLAELERCGYRYYLERVLQLPENRAAGLSYREGADGKGGGGIESRTRGTIIHMLFEAIDFARPRPPLAEDVAGIARKIGASLDRDLCEEIAALVLAALRADPARTLGVARRARREHPFAFSLGHDQPLVTGVLDLIVEQPDGSSLIVDYKSDQVSRDEDLGLLVQRDYGFQRLLYALAVIEAGAQQVEVAHWFLERPSEWVSARFAADEQYGLRERVLARIEGVRVKGFAVTQQPHRGLCLTCPGRGGLCSWGETRTMSERSATLEFDR